MLQAPHILDVSVRDGSYLLHHQFRPEAVAAIASGLQTAGLRYAEVSHGSGIGSKMMGQPGLVHDEDLLAAAQKDAPGLELSVLIPPQDYALPLIPALVDYFSLGRIGVNVDQVATIAPIVQKLKRYHKTVFVQLVRSHARPPEFVAQAAQDAQALGADVVYLVDSYGSMRPEEVKSYLQAMAARTEVALGFHGHNHLGMAVPNAIAAWETGATWLDASLLGVGRAPGNTCLEVLIQLLQTRGFCEEISLAKLCQTTQEVILPLFQSPPQIREVHIFSALNKLDYKEEDLTLLASYLHLSLPDFLARIRLHMKDAVQLSEAHLKATLKSLGQDWDVLMKTLKSVPGKTNVKDIHA